MSESIKVTIDGKELTVPKGTSVIEATEMMGVEIPRFCWHPGLSVAGVCRFCMVKIEGMPKLQIACNTTCTDGMKIITQAQEVKEAHKWALEFHLINHPLDCPICDQAGECELQNYYMKVGKYDSQMEENKVLKPKALDVGRELVLDTERCILCSRCVRFEDEVTKTKSLGIFNRGDHSIIGTFPNKKIDHNYSYNLVDICPVGAFTSKDFRFKCRVWFLKETPSICPGCSTGCNVTLFQNRNNREYYRLKPRRNKDVNGFWMCDDGRHMFSHVNALERTQNILHNNQPVLWKDAKSFFEKEFLKLKVTPQLTSKKVDPDEASQQVLFILTPQYTNEEYDVIFNFMKNKFSETSKAFVWYNSHQSKEKFDGILRRGDSNANTTGLIQKAKEHSVNLEFLDEDMSNVLQSNNEVTVVFGPEISTSYKNFQNDLKKISELKNVLYFGSGKSEHFSRFHIYVPTLTFAEKNGTYTNHNGMEQKLKSNPPVFFGMFGLEDILIN